MFAVFICILQARMKGLGSSARKKKEVILYGWRKVLDLLIRPTNKIISRISNVDRALSSRIM